MTYTLSGADAAPFHIVPATGQILTREKLDYEAKNEYKVTVKATDTTDPDGLDGLSDTIELTIRVTNVDEVPVPKILSVTGENSHTYEENGTDAVGAYAVSVYGGEVASPTWTLEGTDASNFTLTGTGMSRMLKFRRGMAPDYESPTGGADDDSNTYRVTLKVTDPNDRETMGTLEVTVEVTNVDELGTLSGPRSPRHPENGTDVGTYTVSGVGGDTVSWMLEGADASQFRLDGTGMSRMLKFRRAPDYESPTGGTNTYMVTVKVSAGGEMEMREVTVEVTNVDELGTLSGPRSPRHLENGTDVGTYTVSGVGGGTVSWMLEGADASQFRLDSTGMSRMLKFRSAPDYESPTGGANDDSNTYMVTVKVSAGGEMEMREVTITVTNVDELGTLSGPGRRQTHGERHPWAPTQSRASVADTASWMLEGDDASHTSGSTVRA